MNCVNGIQFHASKDIISLGLPVFTFLSVILSVPVPVSLSASTSVCLSVCWSACWSVCRWFGFPVRRSVRPLNRPPSCLFVSFKYVSLSVCQYVCQCVCLSQYVCLLSNPPLLPILPSEYDYVKKLKFLCCFYFFFRELAMPLLVH